MAKRFSVQGDVANTVYDQLGFALENESVAAHRKSAEVHERDVLPNQRKAWAEVAASTDIEATLHTLKKAKKLKQMVRVGIPHELRAKVWPVMSGAAAKRAALNQPGYYARLLKTVEDREAEDVAARKLMEGSRAAGDLPRAPWDLLDTIEQIDKDLMRTFPGHRTIAAPEGQAALRRLLRAYCGGRNPRAGYCQGMNFLAAMLLCVMDGGSLGKPRSAADATDDALYTATGEEGAFWMMVVLVERLLPSDYFTDGLTGVRVDSEILIDLMRERLPNLHAHLKNNELLVLLPMVTTQWFISLFVYWLPTETLLRLWDCFFYDGLKSKNKTFFRAALTLFKLNEAELIKLTDPQKLMDYERSMSRHCHDPEEIVKILYNRAWLGRFTDETLHKMEQAHRLAVAGDVARRAERQAARDAAAKEAATSRKTAAADAARAGSSRMASQSMEGQPIAPDDMTELVAARMHNMSLVLAASDGEEEEGDDGPSAGAVEEEEEEAEWEVVNEPSAVDVSDKGAASLAAAGGADGPAAATDAWEPRGYLLKRSPATTILKRFAWQRRWCEVVDNNFIWHATARSAANGDQPHGKVPLSMILAARPSTQSGCFEVDLGNRVLELALDGVSKANHEATVRKWVDALVNHEQVMMPDEGSHKAKFWKPDQPDKSKTPKSSK